MRKKVAVVGGGITGAFAAYFLAGRNTEVIVVDRDRYRGRASDNNPGGINPLHGPEIPGAMSTFALDCYHLHLAEWQTITDLSRIVFKGRIISRLFLACSDREAGELLESRRLYDATPGFSARWLAADELQRYDSCIDRGAVGGLLTQGNGAVDSARYTRAVLKAAQAKGAKIVAGSVTGLESRGARVRALRIGAERLPSDAFVFATGPWLDILADALDVQVPVRPVRGELLLVRRGADAPTHDVTWRSFGAYHHEKDLFWLGGTAEDAGLDASPSAAGRRAIMKNTTFILPDMERADIVRHVAGLRPVTPDGMPLLGHAPGWDNALLALGGGSKGMLLSSGLGRAAAAGAVDGSPGPGLEFLSPSRFSGPGSRTG